MQRICFLLGLLLLAAAAGAAEETKERGSIGVLPFQVLGDPAKEWLGMGFCDTLTTKLAEVRSLRVVERAQIAAVTGELKLQASGLVDTATAQKVGKFLGAQYVMIGTCQVMGEQMQVTCRQVVVETNAVLEGSSFMTQGKLADVFRIQQEVAQRAAEKLGASLSTAEQERVQQAPTQSVPAYEWVQKGITAWPNVNKPREGNVGFAEGCFREAIKLDPRYTDAHIHLGMALVAQKKPEEGIKELREAVRLDPKYAPARNTLSYALTQTGQFGESEKEAAEAVRLLPNFADAHNNLGVALSKQGKDAEALAAFREAARLDPARSQVRSNLGAALSAQGQHDEAIRELREATRLDPDFAEPHGQLGMALFFKGDLDGSVQEFRTSVKLDPEVPEAHFGLGIALLKKAQANPDMATLEAAVKSLQQFLKLRPEGKDADQVRGILRQLGLDE